jgi:hypothetical protein
MLIRQTFSVGLGRTANFLPWRRRRADEWLRTATPNVVPTAHAWRAAELTSPKRRRLLAETLREVADARARDSAVGGRYRPRHTASVSSREPLEALAATLESENQPVTAAGVLRVLDLITSGTGPLWGTSRQALADALETTHRLLVTQSNVQHQHRQAA